MIKLIIVLYIMSLFFSLCIGVFRFWVDVAKWHDREQKVKITPSSFDNDIKRGGADYDRRNDDRRDNGADNRTGDSYRDGDGDNNGDNNNFIHFGA